MDERTNAEMLAHLQLELGLCCLTAETNLSRKKDSKEVEVRQKEICMAEEEKMVFISVTKLLMPFNSLTALHWLSLKGGFPVALWLLHLW